MLRRLSRSETSDLIRNLKRGGIPFRNRKLAESFLYHKRNSELRELLEFMRSFPELGLDFRPASLKRIENFYVGLMESQKTPANYLKRLEELITQYMRHVLVHNGHAVWTVIENEFAEGRYELGIRYSNGLESQEDFAHDLPEKTSIHGRNYLYESYKKIVLSTQAKEGR